MQGDGPIGCPGLESTLSMLSERQQLILNLLVDAYLESGKPVGSKAIAERADIEWSPSTVRAELAELERAGYLTHPHTSAGRLPTDSGYRFYADSLLASGRRLAGAARAQPRPDPDAPPGGRGDARDDRPSCPG